MKSKSEIWKWVVCYIHGRKIRFKGIYKVSNFGRVKSFKRKTARILKPVLPTMNRNNRYACVTLYKNNRKIICKVHNLVLWTFIGPCPKGLQCRHLNDEREDNHWPENICWGISKENHADAKRNGRMIRAKGECNGNSKLTMRKVSKIRKIWNQSESRYGIRKQLSKRFGISESTVKQIAYNKTWV